MRNPARLFASESLDPLRRSELGLLLRDEGSAMFEGWSDAGAWTIVLPWPEEIRRAHWESIDECETLLNQITSEPLHESDPDAPLPPFLGGWIGFVSYDAGAAAHGVAIYEKHPPEPPAWFARHERGIAIDSTGRSFLFCAPDRREETREALKSALRETAKVRQPVDVRPGASRSPLRQSLDASEYEKAVDSIREAIRRGDLYQVNLTRSFSTEGPVDPVDLYLAIIGEAPPRCSAYINGGSWQIASASPEVFLRYDARLGVAESRPIKGTIERTGDDETDSRVLRSSEKDASEHLMIVDLIRNDFGRVAPPGMVEVASFRDVLTLRHVLHLESTVRASGLQGRPFGEVFTSMFPSGSITGAPKRAVVRFIRELEPVPRGVYTGAIGYWDSRGISEWSVAIRTAVVAGDHARYHAGGGVVWDSEPEAEERESIAKARAFLDYCHRRAGATPSSGSLSPR